MKEVKVEIEVGEDLTVVLNSNASEYLAYALRTGKIRRITVFVEGAAPLSPVASLTP